MTTDEIFNEYKYTVKLTVNNTYKNQHQAESIARNYGLDYQDLLQIGYAELWKMALKHNPKHTNFFGFVTTAIRYALIDATVRYGNMIKLPIKNRQAIRDGITFKDIKDHEEFLPDNKNVETYVINKLQLEEMFSRIKNPINVEMIKLSSMGYEDKEIAAMTGFSAQNVLSRRNRAMKKMVG